MSSNTNAIIKQPEESINVKPVIDIDIASPGMTVAVAKRIKEDIDNYCINTYSSGYRKRMGASAIDDGCKRFIWFNFRWCFREIFNGRMLRLFNRGQREEERYVEWLRGIGCTVWQYEDEANKKQFRMSAISNHVAGFLDSIVKLPPSYQINEPMLGEFKTNSTGKGFAEICANSIALSKKEHFAQMSMYGKAYNLRYGAYFNINKNDDDLHCEIVKLDHNLAEQLLIKAEGIIRSQNMPPRISDQPTFAKCNYCKAKEICHFGKEPDRNCRSCWNAYPAEDAQWYCNHYSLMIPPEAIIKGCEVWAPITKNV
jgi:hypothetical protein